MIKSIFKPLHKVALTLVLLFLTTSTHATFTLVDVPELSASVDENGPNLDNLKKAHSILIQQANRITSTHEGSPTKTHIARCRIILGILPQELTKTTAKKAYHKLCLKFHPDKCKDGIQSTVCEDIFKTISKAYGDITTYFNGSQRLPHDFDYTSPSFMSAATLIHNFLKTASPDAPKDKPSAPSARPRIHKPSARPAERSAKQTAHRNASPPPIAKPAPATRKQTVQTPSASVPPAKATPAPKVSSAPTPPTPTAQPTPPQAAMPKTPNRHAQRPHAGQASAHPKKSSPSHKPAPVRTTTQTAKQTTTAQSRTPSRHAPRHQATTSPIQHRKIPTSPTHTTTHKHPPVPPLNFKKLHERRSKPVAQKTTSAEFTYKQDLNNCWWLTIRGHSFMLVNQYKKFKYPALIAHKGISSHCKKMPATIEQHSKKAQLIPFPLCEAEMVAVFYVLLLAGISKDAVTRSLKPNPQIQRAIHTAAQMVFGH